MERLNKETLSFPAMQMTRMMAAVAMIFVMVACGNGGGGGATPPPVTQIPPSGCLSCSGISSPVVLTTFQTQSSDGMMLFKDVQLFVESSRIAANASGNNYNWYQGPISIQGTMELKQTLFDVMPGTGTILSACAIPAGTYYVQSNGPGQMSYMATDISIPSIVTSSGSIELSLEAPSLGGYGLTNQGRGFFGLIGVRKVNGIQCSSQFFGVFSSAMGYF